MISAIDIQDLTEMERALNRPTFPNPTLYLVHNPHDKHEEHIEHMVKQIIAPIKIYQDLYIANLVLAVGFFRCFFP